jgi:hypothetical protein
MKIEKKRNDSTKSPFHIYKLRIELEIQSKLEKVR